MDNGNPRPGPDLGPALDAVSTEVGAAGRSDLLARLSAIRARSQRPTTVVVVVGEFKQGKSALVNGLLGVDVCPVDDSLATSVVTVVSYGDEPEVSVRRRTVEGALESVPAPFDALQDLIVEPSADGVVPERVDIRVPAEILAEGMVLVDTPGIGGLHSAHGAATRAFLPYADALVYVSDAGAELAATEVAFLADAAALCPDVLFALTKTDLFPEWRRVSDLDAEHLRRAGHEPPILPVSHPVVQEALATGDPATHDESGYPALAGKLASVGGRAKTASTGRAVAESRWIIGQVVAADREELVALSDPSATESKIEELRAASERVDALSDANAQWQRTVTDGFGDLSHDVTHAFRAAIRSADQAVDEGLERARKREEIEAVVARLQDDVAAAVHGAFESLNQGVERLGASVADLLAEDAQAVNAPGFLAGVGEAATSGWSAVEVEKLIERGGRGDVLAAVRGAQGGIVMLAVMGGLLPAAAASVVAATPFLLGAGIVFGTKGIADVRDRRAQQARQKARQTLKRVLDDVQFQVGAELTEALRLAQRHLRDEVGGRLLELSATTKEAVGRLAHAAKADAADHRRRIEELTARVARLEVLDEGLAAMSTAGGEAGAT
ncbi:MAG: dynamin family protein [Actinobacteria bacterium]|nr:dynamin family protein [Actinomycetota bacterium]